MRVIARGPSFESLLSEAFDQIRQNAESNVAILLRLLGALQTVAGLDRQPEPAMDAPRRRWKRSLRRPSAASYRRMTAIGSSNRLACVRDVLDMAAAS